MMSQNDVRKELPYEPPRVQRVRIDPVKELLSQCTSTKTDGLGACIPPQS